ncbi:MAG: carbonic anhydrase [Gammaproteobacteria bacterium]|nr:carbonic anhydrase [Gammaproteobacteria bacterium]
MMKADQALEKLRQGNANYVSAIAEGRALSTSLQRQPADLVQQRPFAIVLGCSDSRVPAELVFDQGLGDLFVIRVAGNIVAPSQIGSIEFACQQFGTQLVVVLGHSHCGAIEATVDALTGNPDDLSPNLAAIVDRVMPAVHPVVRGHEHDDREQLLHQAMKANVEQSVKLLQLRSRIIRGLINRNELTIVGAEYSIETGRVTFYSDGSSEEAS